MRYILLHLAAYAGATLIQVAVRANHLQFHVLASTLEDFVLDEAVWCLELSDA